MREREPEVIYRNGKPAAVILDIDEYEELLERLEDAEDLRVIREMRRKPLQFRRLADFLKEYQKGSETASFVAKDAPNGPRRVRRSPGNRR